MMLGMLVLFFELSNPGVILPGVIGGISLILAFFAFQSLPINYAGLLLILFGIVLLVAEIKIVSHGVLAIGGTISMRSEEHTSELQSRSDLVCRLLLEKKNKTN